MILAGLVDVIHWLEDVFERLQLRRSYRGAIAYNYYAPPRLTQDVDVLVLVPDIKVPELLDEFDRPKDIGDIKAMLMAQKGKLDIERLLSDAQQLLSDDGYRELESLVRQFA
jgi:hypothetical protein